MRTTLKLSEIVREWMLDLDVLSATKEDYKRKIELWFRWLASVDVDPREPHRHHILEYKQHLQQQGKSIFTSNSYVTVVKLFYSYCELRHYYDNIGLGIKSSTKQREHYKHPLSREQSNKLLASIDTSTIVGKRDKLMIALMLTNGLRTCEVNRINIEDFDKEGDQTVLYIQRKGRTDKRERVATPPIIDELLEDYISCREFSGEDPLFINHTFGRKAPARLRRTSISIIIKHRLKSAGIDDPKISAHSLRHTCGSLMVEEGLEVEDIRDMLGHTDTRVTRIYIDMARQKRLLESSPSKKIAGILFKKQRK